MTRVRGALETLFSPGATSTLLFEALERFGSDAEQSGRRKVPTTNEELLTLIRTGLLPALERRMDPEKAATTAQQVEAALLRTSQATELPRPAKGKHRVDPDATAAVPTVSLAVPTCVVAASSTLRDQLFAVLGPKRISPIHVNNLTGLVSVLPPAIVILDSTDFAAIEPEALHLALAKFPTTTVHVVWGADLPYGRSLAKVLAESPGGAQGPGPEQSAVRLVTIERAEGVEPLLDLIRARRSAPDDD